MFKFKEDELLREIEDHIRGTYSSHYAGNDNTQAIDIIFAGGHGEGFSVGSAIKYLARYGKKNGKNRMDLLKAIHYTLFLLYLQDKEEDTLPGGEDDALPF